MRNVKGLVNRNRDPVVDEWCRASPPVAPETRRDGRRRRAGDLAADRSFRIAPRRNTNRETGAGQAGRAAADRSFSAGREGTPAADPTGDQDSRAEPATATRARQGPTSAEPGRSSRTGRSHRASPEHLPRAQQRPNEAAHRPPPEPTPAKPDGPPRTDRPPPRHRENTNRKPGTNRTRQPRHTCHHAGQAGQTITNPSSPTTSPQVTGLDPADGTGWNSRGTPIRVRAPPAERGVRSGESRTGSLSAAVLRRRFGVPGGALTSTPPGGMAGHPVGAPGFSSTGAPVEENPSGGGQRVSASSARWDATEAGSIQVSLVSTVTDRPVDGRMLFAQRKPVTSPPW